MLKNIFYASFFVTSWGSKQKFWIVSATFIVAVQYLEFIPKINFWGLYKNNKNDMKSVPWPRQHRWDYEFMKLWIYDSMKMWSFDVMNFLNLRFFEFLDFLNFWSFEFLEILNFIEFLNILKFWNSWKL